MRLARVADGAERRVAADADGLEARRAARRCGRRATSTRRASRAWRSGGGCPRSSRPRRGRAPYSRALGALDLAAEQVRDELQAVADAEDGHAELEDARVDRRRALGVHAGRAARQDDGARSHRAELLEGEGARVDLAVDALLADAARDELRVLGAEVEDENELAGRRDMDDHEYQSARGRQALAGSQSRDRLRQEPAVWPSRAP